MTVKKTPTITERLDAETPLIQGWRVWWTMHGELGETVIWNARLEYHPSGEVLHADTPEDIADKTRHYEAAHPDEVTAAAKRAPARTGNRR